MSALTWWACACGVRASVQRPTLIEAQTAAVIARCEHERDTHGDAATTREARDRD
jgi:hypothetical protein